LLFQENYLFDLKKSKFEQIFKFRNFFVDFQKLKKIENKMESNNQSHALETQKPQKKNFIKNTL
jgi:hypothetical protein